MCLILNLQSFSDILAGRVRHSGCGLRVASSVVCHSVNTKIWWYIKVNHGLRDYVETDLKVLEV